MSNAIISQVSKNLLFRFRIYCHQLPDKPTGQFELPESFRLPAINEFEGQKSFADIRIGWRDEGIYVSVNVTGKKQSIWCRDTQLMESDGLQMWFDTRATHNVHRASKFCHWMMFLPTGGGPSNDRPIARMLKINRTKDDSPTINRAKLEVASKTSDNGYSLSVFVPGTGLHGWNAAEHRYIGFNYAIVDRELGWQTLAI